MNITIPYYEDNSRYNNSIIGNYIKYGPKYVRDYLDGKIENMKASYLSKGTMIHMNILQKDEFWDVYRTLDFEKPKSKQQIALCETFAKANKNDPMLTIQEIALKAYKESYNNTKSDAVCEKEAMDIISTYKEYINFLENEDNKILINNSDERLLHTIHNNLKSHKLANLLLFEQKRENCYNEFHINWEYPVKQNGIYAKCKSLLDRLIIDKENKVITLIDIKTTVSLYEFENSIVDYDYCRQLAFYWTAIHWYMKNVLNINVFEEDYDFKTYIIAISSQDGQVRVLDIDAKSIENKMDIIHDTLFELTWHDVNVNWDQVRSYYEGDGSELYKA